MPGRTIASLAIETYSYHLLTMYIYTVVTEACPFDGDIKCNDTGICHRSTVTCNGYSTCRYGTDEEDCGN